MGHEEQRKPKPTPTRITFRDLITAAQSGDPNQRKQAFTAYQAWVRAAPNIPSASRLTYMQRDVLNKIFAQKGFSVGQLPRGR